MIMTYIEKQSWPNKHKHIIVLLQPNIGSLEIDVYPNEQDIAYISYLYIQKECRKNGYGTQLLKTAEDYIKQELNINRVGLWISIGMTADYAYNWYIKNDYNLESDKDKDEHNIFLIKYIG